MGIKNWPWFLAMAGNAVGLGNFPPISLFKRVQKLAGSGFYSLTWSAFVLIWESHSICRMSIGSIWRGIQWHHSTPYILDSCPKSTIWNTDRCIRIFTQYLRLRWHTILYESWDFSCMSCHLLDLFTVMSKEAYSLFFDNYVHSMAPIFGILLLLFDYIL